MMETDAQTGTEELREAALQATGIDPEATDVKAEAAQADAAQALAEARALADARYEELQYARAEIENVRKRAEKIALERLKGGRQALVGKFLPVVDNLRRATTYENSEGLREGLNATLKEFEALLAGENLRPIEIVGKPFDPRLAEAIATRETSDVEDGTVIEEVRRGYTLDGEVVRPALVVVAKRPESSP